MKFVFNGDGKTEFLWINWVAGVPVDVDKAEHIAILKRHPHFDEVAGETAGRSEPNAFDDHAVEAAPEAESIDTSSELAALTDDELEALTAPESESVKRGRPKSSKNKPKDDT